NASYGYRAAFYQSPGTGMDANRLFLKAITPRLLADHSNASIHIDSKLIAESLTNSIGESLARRVGKGALPRLPDLPGRVEHRQLRPSRAGGDSKWAVGDRKQRQGRVGPKSAIPHKAPSHGRIPGCPSQ